MRLFNLPVIMRIFALGIIVACGGCATAMIESAVRSSGVGYAEGEVPSRKPKALPLPLVCFTLSLDATDWPELAPGAVWFFTINNLETKAATGVQIKPNGPVTYKSYGGMFSGVPSNPTHLVLLKLPAGRYSLGRICFQNDINCEGRFAAFDPNYIGLDKKKTYVFTVKNAQLTYAGRLTMKFTGERGLFGLKASSVDYHVLWSDTVPEDELWAEAAFPVLRNMPSGAEPMYCLPVSTQH